MPEYGFVTTHRWIKQIAQRHGIRISSRKAERVAVAWMDYAELAADGVAGGGLDYRDTVGDEAVAHILAELRKVAR